MDHEPTGPTDRAADGPPPAAENGQPQPTGPADRAPDRPAPALDEGASQTTGPTDGAPDLPSPAVEDGPPHPSSLTGRARWWPVAVVALLAGAATAVIAVAGPSTRPAVGRPAPPVEAADDAGARDGQAVAAFLAAWERSAGGTYVVRSTFERRLGGDRSMTAEVVLAQRPPDRLTGQDGSRSGRVGGRLVACADVDGDAVPCADAGAAPRWGDQVAAEVAAVRRLVSGPSSRYAVAAGPDGCFSLRLRVWEPAAPYGTSATFCFDPSTGAPTRTEIVRPEGTDVTRATDIRPPSDADFRLPD